MKVMFETVSLNLVPAPMTMNLVSDPVSPVRPIGSTVTLTCTVQLSTNSNIDVQLSVALQILRDNSPLTSSPSSTSGSTYTSTAVVSSFGRDESDNYTCRANVTPMTPNEYLIQSKTSTTAEVTVGKTALYFGKTYSTKCFIDLLMYTSGIYLWLSGQFIANESSVPMNNIGIFDRNTNANAALQCITDRNPSCASQNPRLGEWYLPSGEIVRESTSTTEFYRNRGDNGGVFLNRPSDTMSPAGRFCCEVADATSRNKTVCVNIGEHKVVNSCTYSKASSPL